MAERSRQSKPFGIRGPHIGDEKENVRESSVRPALQQLNVLSHDVTYHVECDCGFHNISGDTCTYLTLETYRTYLPAEKPPWVDASTMTVEADEAGLKKTFHEASKTRLCK